MSSNFFNDWSKPLELRKHLIDGQRESLEWKLLLIANIAHDKNFGSGQFQVFLFYLLLELF